MNLLFIFALLSTFLNLTNGSTFSKTGLRGLKKMPATIDKIELDKYLGNWYQIYGSPTNVLFQGYGKCITAEYSALPNAQISVLNKQLNANNELEQISGYGFYKNSSEPGQLTIHLDGTPVDAPYWIVSLGEVVNGQYQYSIVTTPSGISLWVLARDIDVFMKNYDSEVKKYLNEYQYMYVPIQQDETCNVVQNMLGANYKSECQVATYLKNAGFPQTSIATMVCISKYESSYNCDATNKNTDGSSDYGLMQINSYYWCSGDPLSKYNSCNVKCTSLYDCQLNANCAYIVWKQQGYNAWYGYKYHKTECDNYKINC